MYCVSILFFVYYLLLIYKTRIVKADGDSNELKMKHPFNEKIIGGKPATIKEYPYQLSLQLMGRHVCGASMIGRNWALTAAHCTYRSPAINFTIRAGTSYNGYGGEVIAVKRIHEHPSYDDKNYDYDISVVELVAPITAKGATSISLASWYNFLFPWLRGTATGWGATKENGTLTWQLRAVTISIIDYYNCYLSYGPVITSRMFCAGKESKDSCQGDSGGPLVINGKLYGVVSFGVGCGRPEFAFRSFINGIAGV